MKGTKRKGITALVGGLIVIIILLIGVAAYAFLYPPTSSGSTVTSTKTVTGAQASAIGKLKVGIILPLTPSDDSWNYNANNAIQQLKSEFNFTLSESENIASSTDAAVPAQQWASEGYNVVIFMGGQYQQEANTFGGQYPSIMSVCVDCTVANYSNVYRVWLDLSGGGFVLGAMAGMVSQAHKFGLVGGGDIPSIWEGHEGFIAGITYTYPACKGTCFTNTFEAFAWADVNGAESTATNDYTSGADVVFSSGDGVDVGVLGAALAQPSSPQVWASNVYTNLTAINPADNKILLGSIVVDYYTPFFKALQQFVSGNWHNGYTKVDMASGLISVQPGPDLPANVKAAGLALESDIVEGSIIISFASTSGGSPYCFVNTGSQYSSSCGDSTLTIPSGGGIPTGNMAALFSYLPPASSLP
jgi:basic membrane protein A and related proteins